MNISALKESKFLKKEDAGKGILVTIKSVEELNVAKEGAPQEFRWCLWFQESEKPMVLNSTNGQIIAQITGSDDTDGWTGHKIVLYHDPAISYAGKIVGGIRCRAPRNQPAAPATPAPAPKPEARPAQATAPVKQTPHDEVEAMTGDDPDVPF
jgi:hypothetical protein